MLIRVLAMVLLIENDTTSHQILSRIDNGIIMWQIRVNLNNDSLLLGEGHHLILVLHNIELIPFLDTFPADAARMMSVHRRSRIV